MNAFRIFGTLALAVAGLPASMAAAQSAAPTAPYVDEKYLISRGPAEFGRAAPIPLPAESAIEKPAALDGSSYTVISPIFTGDAGNISYIRFPNFDSPAVSATTVTVVGSQSGTVYGTTTVLSQPYTSPQMTISEILSAAKVTAAANATNEGYALYLKNPLATSEFQHVIYSSNSDFFENMSVCTYVNAKSYHYLNQSINNVHTTILKDYPAFVMVQNITNASVYFQLDMYNATSGALVGSYLATAAPNGTYALPVSTLQAQAGWAPGTSDSYMNIVVKTPTITGFSLVVGQYIFNSKLTAYVNMSQACPINN